MTDPKGNPKDLPPPDAAGSDSNDLDERASVRRTTMVGIWAAELLGLIGHAAHDYVKALTHSHHASGEEGLFRKLVHDLEGKASVHEIREKMRHLLQEAREQLRREKK